MSVVEVACHLSCIMEQIARASALLREQVALWLKVTLSRLATAAGVVFFVAALVISTCWPACGS